MRFAAQAPRVDASGAIPLGATIRWIDSSPTFAAWQRRQVRVVAIGFSAALFAMILVPVIFLYPKVDLASLARILDANENLRWKLIEIVVVFVAYIAALPFLLRKAGRKIRLGASLDGMHYEAEGNGPRGAARGRAPWREVLYDGNWLVAGKKRFVLRRPGAPIPFDPEELRTIVLAHIPGANIVTPSQLQMRLMGPLVWILLAGVLAVGVWLVAQNV